MQPNIDVQSPTGDQSLQEAMAAVEGMTLDEIKRQLVEIRVKQRIVQLRKAKKPAKVRAPRIDRKALLKALLAKAQEHGLYDQVLVEVRQKAEAKRAAELAAKAQAVPTGAVEAA